MKILKSISMLLLVAVACMELGCGLGHKYTSMPPGYRLLTDGKRYKFADDEVISVKDFGSSNSAIYWANKNYEDRTNRQANDDKWHNQ